MTTAIERLRAVIGPVYPGSDNARDLAAVDALYQAAKAVADYDPFSKNASTEWGDRRRALAAAVRRVEGK